MKSVSSRSAQDALERDRVVSDADLDVLERAREARPQHAPRDIEGILGEIVEVDQRPGDRQIGSRGGNRQVDVAELGQSLDLPPRHDLDIADRAGEVVFHVGARDQLVEGAQLARDSKRRVIEPAHKVHSHHAGGVGVNLGPGEGHVEGVFPLVMVVPELEVVDHGAFDREPQPLGLAGAGLGGTGLAKLPARAALSIDLQHDPGAGGLDDVDADLVGEE